MKYILLKVKQQIRPVLFPVYGCIIFSLVLSLPLTSQSQNISYRKFKYQWEESLKANDTIYPTFANEPAVVLEKQVKILIDDVTNVSTVTEKIIVKFLTEEGVKKYSVFNIPESFNKQLDYYDRPFHLEIGRPKFYNLNMEYFAARILKPEGQVIQALVNDNPQAEPQILGLRPDRAYSYNFQITNVKAGDIAEIRFKYSLPYTLHNGTCFFHGDMPIQKVDFQFLYRAGAYFVFDFRNGGQPTDSLNVKYGTREFKGFQWKVTNLFSVADEVQSRYHADLPNLSFYLHYKDFGILNDNGTTERYTPYPWGIALYKYFDYGYRWLYEDDRVYRTTKAMRYFFEECTSYQDSSLHGKLSSMQEYVNDSLDYEDDFAYIKGKDISLENIAAHLVNKKILRWETRHYLYAKILELLKTAYFDVYVFDKRVSAIKEDYASPIQNLLQTHCNIYFQPWRHYYAVTFDDSPFYFSPKLHRFGHHLDELPFYYEDTKVILASADRTQQHPVNFIFLETPGSEPADNFRSCNILSKVDPASNLVTFEANVTLSGQFSTMTRGYYLYDYIDSLVNPLYFQRINQIGKASKLISFEVTNSEIMFPFKTQFKVKYESNEILKTKENGEFEIDLKGLFQHVYPANFQYTNRDLPFYNDFKFDDQFSYYFEFPFAVEPVNESEIQLDLNNNYGKLKIIVQNVKPETVMIKSQFFSDKEKMEPDKISDAKKIFNGIDRLGLSKLQVKKVQ